MEEINLIATSAFGIESLVKNELIQLGYDAKIISPGRIHFRGGVEAICQANLWLRCADRVLVQVGQFPATDFGKLFDCTQALDWARWIGPHDAFPVNGKSIKSQLSSVPACQRMVKKSIVESLKAAHGVEVLDESGPERTIEIALLDNVASLNIDTTGPGLNKRGYRKLMGRAPMKETLAAALVLLSFWKPDRPLIDPFCGTGTIPIEAALIGRRIAPGLYRSFAAETWPSIPKETWSRSRDSAASLALPSLPINIIGSDRDPEALSMAGFHAKQAGVQGDIHFQQREFEELSNKRDYGCIITNPPYGQRLNEHDELRPLYESMPTVLRRLPTWSHFIFTSYPGFERIIQKKADRRRKLYNARIECTYFQIHGPRKPRESTENIESGSAEPTKTSAPRKNPWEESIKRAARTAPEPDAVSEQAFGGLDSKASEQAELFRSRLKKRAKHLRRWPTRRGITCFRIYERDIPEIPLIVDRLEGYIHITEYERPHERDLGQHADWLDLMARVAGEALEVDPTHVVLKSRQRQRGNKQYEKHSSRKKEVEVQEGELKLLVNLWDYADTGLFLDHRATRSMVRDEANGKRFLNLFCYTGSFTVYAGSGGASESVSVDLSQNYLEWAERNMEINDLASPQHQFVQSDILSYLKETQDEKKFDLAVVDPPTFSNSKRTEDDWEVQRDHVELLHLVSSRMNPGGVIYFSTNFRRFKLNEEELSPLQIREITNKTLPEDFRNRRIHRCWRMTV